uniref:Uncharacterized protein n=1 Tax=Burkholderia sp. M701 TaxID=326454 RepID=V5YPH2_9BURK|nr:hypothetical protein [Burkholderia sp. M701]
MSSPGPCRTKTLPASCFRQKRRGHIRNRARIQGRSVRALSWSLFIFHGCVALSFHWRHDQSGQSRFRTRLPALLNRTPAQRTRRPSRQQLLSTAISRR